MADTHTDREIIVTDSGGGLGVIIGVLVAVVLAGVLLWTFAFNNNNDAPVDVNIEQEQAPQG